MSTDLERYNAIEQVVIAGDLAKLAPGQRVEYYRKVCDSVGLNYFTQPFAYITLNGKLTLYARKDATDQLRRIHGISITDLVSETISDVYCVTAHAMTKDGRTDQDTGAVYVGGLKGDALANAIMKARTKAKRRVTLSIAGLGWLDETEVDTIPGAQTVVVEDTGEIVTGTPPPTPPPTVTPPPATNGNGKRDIQHASEGSMKRLHQLGELLYKDKWGDKRHELAEYVSKGATKSSKELSATEINSLIAGMETKLHDVAQEQEGDALFDTGTGK